MRRPFNLLGAGALAVVAGCAPAEADEATMAEADSAAQAKSPPACRDADNWGDILKPGYRIPCDFSTASGEPTLAEHYRFAWNTFFAINWPAANPNSARGIPDASADYGAAGRTPVWDTWKEKRELYRVVVPKPTGTDKGPRWSSQDPGSFQSFPDMSRPDDRIKMCSGAEAPTGAIPRLLQSDKTENYLDETGEIGLVVLWRGTDRMPNNENLVRYQVKLNADYYNYVRDNDFYHTKALNQHIKQTTDNAHPVGQVDFPASSRSTGNNGAIMLKTGWMRLTGDQDVSDYYTVDALYYDETGPNSDAPCYRTATFGLIALHLVRKTEKFPYFFYSTFAHDGVADRTFNYANTNGVAETAVKGPLQPTSCPGEPTPFGKEVSSTLPNGCGIEYNNPANPVAGLPRSLEQPYTAKRLIRPRSALQQVNQAAESGPNQGTVWANYHLVGVQTQPVAGKPNNPNPAGDQDYYLANPVVETSQRFQYFTGTFASPRSVNVYKGADGGGRVMMGGCMGCHGAGAQGGAKEPNDVKQGSGGTDFSFTLNNVRSEPDAFAAETIADQCKQIGLVYVHQDGSCGYSDGSD